MGDIPLYESGLTRVADSLMARKPEAYIPHTISLGPFCFDGYELEDAEKKKQLLQDRFPYRERHFEALVDSMMRNLSRIRNWYDIGYSSPAPRDLGSIMALDGIYLLQFLREISPMDYERSVSFAETRRWADLQGFPNLEENVTRKIREQLRPLRNQEVQEDSLKLQNQIPFFVLKMIIQWEEETYQAVRKTMAQAALTHRILKQSICIGKEEEGKEKDKMPPQKEGKAKDKMPLLKEVKEKEKEGKEKEKMLQQKEGKEKEMLQEMEMLQDMMGKILQDMMLQARTGTNQDLDIILKRALRSLSPLVVGEKEVIVLGENAHLLGFVHANILGRLTQYNGGEGNQKKILPARAVALDNKGVKFAAYPGPLNKIRFDRNTWTFHLPRIEISERTDAVLRNLLAFESSARDETTKPIKCYVELMDQLINTAEDVEVLKKGGVIHHLLGTDEEVANIWNSMREGHDQAGKYGPIDIAIDEVIKFYGSYRIWFSEGVKKFFSKPWLVVSFIAGCIVVITAIVQTIFSGLQLHHQ